jgi:hypothetical protein
MCTRSAKAVGNDNWGRLIDFTQRLRNCDGQVSFWIEILAAILITTVCVNLIFSPKHSKIGRAQIDIGSFFGKLESNETGFGLVNQPVTQDGVLSAMVSAHGGAPRGGL